VLSADAVLIASTIDASTPTTIATVGISARDAAVIQRAVAALLEETGRASLRLMLSERVDADCDKLRKRGVKAVLAEPIALEGRDLGFICAMRRRDGEFANDRLLGVFARHAAAALAPSEQDAAALAERLAFLQTLDDSLAQITGLEEVTDNLDRWLVRLFGSALTGIMIGIMVHDEDRAVLQMLPGSFGATRDQAASYQVSTDNAFSNAARVFTTGQAYVSNDARSDPGILADYKELFGIQRILSVALRVAGKPVGVLHVANKPTEFTAEDLDRAHMIAPRVATVVELWKGMWLLRRQQSQEESLARAAVNIASGQALQEFLPDTLSELAHALDASATCLVFLDGRPIVARVADRHPRLEALLVEETKAHPEPHGSMTTPERAGDPGVALRFEPIVFRERRVGTVGAMRARGDPFTTSEREALVRLANLLALAWASERYQQQRAQLARLAERQRIADDLHDDVAQLMFAAKMRLETIESQGESGATLANVEHSRKLISRAEDALRTIIQEIAPKPAADLPSQLAAIVADIENEFGLAVHMEVSPAADATAGDLRVSSADALLRVARESLVNAAKHAGPCRVAVTLDAEPAKSVMLTVVDDGIGLSDRRADGRHGLAALRRVVRNTGGSLSVAQGVAGGTSIRVDVPL
jgi:signal transduction histidine kinase